MKTLKTEQCVFIKTLYINSTTEHDNLVFLPFYVGIVRKPGNEVAPNCRWATKSNCWQCFMKIADNFLKSEEIETNFP